MRKRPFIIAGILIIPLFGLSVLCAYNLHLLLSGAVAQCTLNLIAAFRYAQSIPKVMRMALIILGVFVCILAAIVLTQTYLPYRSQMRTISSDIKVPEPAGQGQYGTAVWLPERKIATIFTAVEIDQNSAEFQHLLKAARRELVEKHID